MDEGEVLEGTIDVGKDQAKVQDDSVYMTKGQVLEGEGVDKFQHEVLETINEVAKVHDEVLDAAMDLIKVQAIVDNDKFQDKVLDDDVDVDKVLQGGLDVNKNLNSSVNLDKVQCNITVDGVEMEKVQDKVLGGGMEVNKFRDKVLKGGVEEDKDLEGGLDMNKVQHNVLDGGMDANRFQDKVMRGAGGLNKAEDNTVKGNVNENEIHDKVLNEVLEEPVDMDKAQHKLDNSVDVDKTLDQVLMGSEDVNENSMQLNKTYDMVLVNGVYVGKVLNGQEQMDTMRCQVKITTCHNLRLRMANYTARDVYVRLLGHGERIAGSGLLALKDSVHLSPLKQFMVPEDPELDEPEYQVQEMGQEDSHFELDEEMIKQEVEEDDEDGSHAISDTAYSPCSSVMPTPVEETQSGVDFLFQSPGHLLKELHADPEMQAELWAERHQELTRDAAHQSLCSRSHGTPHIQAFLHSAARLIAVAAILFLLLLVLLLVLLESDLDVSFLQDIRETPEFEQFHYEYYCPLRRWLWYKLELLTEHLWGD